MLGPTQLARGRAPMQLGENHTCRRAFHANQDDATLSKGFPGGSGAKDPLQCRRRRRCGFDPWVGKIPWRRAWQPTPVFSLESPVDRGAWRAAVQGVAESDTTETQHARDAFPASTLLPRLFLSVGVRTARLLSSRRELTEHNNG